MPVVPRDRHGARLLAAGAAGLACREDLLEFKADKRGRSCQVFDVPFLKVPVLGRPTAALLVAMQERPASPYRSPQGGHARKRMCCPSLQVVVTVSCGGL